MNIRDYQKAYVRWEDAIKEYNRQGQKLLKQMPKTPNIVFRHYRQKLQFSYSPAPSIPEDWGRTEPRISLSHWWPTSGWLCVRYYTLEQFQKVMVSDDILEIPGEVSHSLTENTKKKLQAWAEEIGL